MDIPPDHTIKIEDLLTSEVELSPMVTASDVADEYILKGLGMCLSDAEPYLLTLIRELKDQCRELAIPRAAGVVIRDIRFDMQKNKVYVSDIPFTTGKVVATFLKKSEAVFLFTSTCGSGIEHLSKKLMNEGNTLEGYIVDLIGSEMAELIAEYLHVFIEDKLTGTGFGVTNRFSPGYCNWPVSEQHKLFGLLQGHDCGIELTGSSLMIPVKSVSGMFGIGHGLKRVAYKCNICRDDKCILRTKM